MKKVLTIGLMMVMLLSMGVTVFAAPNGFVSSPSGTPAPEIIEVDPGDEDCVVDVIVTTFDERHELSEDIRDTFEKAYQGITEAEDLTKLNDDLADIANNKKISAKNLAVGDFFNLHAIGCDTHDEHVNFDITLSAETLSHFVALLHMTKDGTWEMIKDAKVVNNGEHLKFSLDALALETSYPFAVVVDKSGASESPKTGNNYILYICAAIMVASAISLTVIATKEGKQKA